MLDPDFSVKVSVEYNEPEQEGWGERWYVPHDGDKRRFVGADGMPSLRLIEYRDSGGELVLRLCEDSTGLLVGPTDSRLPHAGILVSQLRGERYRPENCRAGNFSLGAEVSLRPEPLNPHDDRAVAVCDRTGKYHAAYLDKPKARAYLKRIAAGEELSAISIRGTGKGKACDQIAVLVATPEVVKHLLSPRPAHAPPPAHLR